MLYKARRLTPNTEETIVFGESIWRARVAGLAKGFCASRSTPSSAGAGGSWELQAASQAYLRAAQQLAQKRDISQAVAVSDNLLRLKPRDKNLVRNLRRNRPCRS